MARSHFGLHAVSSCSKRGLFSPRWFHFVKRRNRAAGGHRQAGCAAWNSFIQHLHLYCPNKDSYLVGHPLQERADFPRNNSFCFFFIDITKKHHQRNSPPDSVAGIPRQLLREEEEKSITQAVTVASQLPEENIPRSSLSLSA